MKTRGITITIGAILFVVIGWYGYVHRVGIKARFFTTREAVPVAVNRNTVVTNTPVTNTSNSNTNRPVPLPSEFNLSIPFTSQAPNANWDKEHEEFCEEASVLMVSRYWQDRTIKDVNDAEQALQQIKAWEVSTLGYFEDTTAVEISRILREFYGFGNVVVLKDPTADDIKREVVAGHPVIVPAAGRLLGNPNFKSPGPLYHALVIKGYTNDGKFITNDPGTRKGADYVYTTSVIMNALHDWNGGDVVNGDKAVIVVRGK